MTPWASIDTAITTLFPFSLAPTSRFAQNTSWQWTQPYEVPKLLLTLTTEGEFSEGELNLFFKVFSLNWGWHAGKKIQLCLKQFPCHYWKLFHGTFISLLWSSGGRAVLETRAPSWHIKYFQAKHLPCAFPKVSSTHNFSWLVFQRHCNAATKWACVLHLKIAAMWFI